MFQKKTALTDFITYQLTIFFFITMKTDIFLSFLWNSGQSNACPPTANRKLSLHNIIINLQQLVQLWFIFLDKARGYWTPPSRLRTETYSQESTLMKTYFHLLQNTNMICFAFLSRAVFALPDRPYVESRMLDAFLQSPSLTTEEEAQSK